MSTQINKGTNDQIINQQLDERVISKAPKTTKTLEPGKSIGTYQGGMEYPLMFKEVLAGEKIESYSIDSLTRILTPLVPTMDRIYVTFKAFFVPHTRVWSGAEKALAGKGSLENESLKGGNEIQIPYATLAADQPAKLYFRNTLANRYGIPSGRTATTIINLLPHRGYRAIQNDFLINKEYELPQIEWNNGGAATTGELAALNCFIGVPTGTNSGAYVVVPGKARHSYLTNIKKSMQFSGTVVDSETMMPTDDVIQWAHLDWQTQFNDMKQRAVNANKNDWDIIAEMGNAPKVLNDRVQLLGMLDMELNYQQITQSAPQIDESSPLGTAGSFSYTRANGTLFNGKVFPQHGYIHILMNINIDTITDGGIPKELLKREVNQIYRPGLAEIEHQTITRGEYTAIGTQNASQFVAYQPAWAEYNRLPNIVSGQMSNNQPENQVSNSQWHNAMDLGTGSFIMSPKFLNPNNYINLVLQRNNILNLPPAQTVDWQGVAGTIMWQTDPVMNMTMHKVKTALPIANSTLTSTSNTSEIK